MKSIVLILPAEHRAAGNGVAIALGHDVPPGHTYAVPLAANAAEPATHYGCHTLGTDGFAVMVEIVATGVVPPGTSSALEATALGVRAQQPGMAGTLVWSIRPDVTDGHSHFEDVIAANGLQRIPWVV